MHEAGGPPQAAECLRPYAGTTTTNLLRYLEVGVAAALEAGRLIAAAFHQPKAVTTKQGPVDLVTETDQAAELAIFGIIREAFPSHAFIGEEASAAQGGPAAALTDEPTWMVDPLDGTTNFVHSFPWVCTSIALCIGKKTVVAVVYNPVSRELYTAVQGGGAHVNGRPLRASGQTRLAASLVITEVGTARDDETMDAMLGRVRAVTRRARALRCCGSCALDLCCVAEGRADVSYEVGFGGCWDAAAGGLIVAEAGGVVVDPAGGPWDVMGRRVLAAASRELAEEVTGLLAGCKDSSTEPAAATASSPTKA